MSSVAATNPGLNYLTQLLSGSGSPLLSSGMSSSQIQSALQNASPTDIAQLSEEAMQLEDVSILFGSLDGLTTASNPSETLDSILSSLSGSAGDSTTSPSLSAQMATYQSQQQAAETQTLLGEPSTNLVG